MTQNEALAILKTGTNVFLTGEAGSGKTYAINEYAAYLRARGIEPAITASTGIAATHLGGMTIHSWSGIGIKSALNKYDLNRIASNERIEKRIQNTKVLIIDEVSMLAPETLSMVDAVCGAVKQNQKPFGGIQTIFVGDFFQLPPVVKNDTELRTQTVFLKRPSASFAYDCQAWVRANPTICYLTDQYRQDDNNFLELLSAIRRNAFSANHLRLIEARKIERQNAPSGVPKLFSHNADVDFVNREMLAKLPGNLCAFGMSSQGPQMLMAVLKKGCLSPETLSLKVDATVMFTKNNLYEGFVNGTLGIVTGFNEHNGYPIVKLRNGRRIAVKPMSWTIEEGGVVRARITQLPLRLAWAITVHKSQGMSMDEAIMDLSAVFEFGQGYVALSRVRRLSGLHILGWNERAFQVHPEALAKDEAFRAASGEAEMVFSKLSSDEFQTMQNNFVTVCGGNNRALETASKRKSSRERVHFKKIRETHPNAYLPWDEAQDAQLRKLFAQGSSVADLVKIFGRKAGAIRARLVKLGLT